MLRGSGAGGTADLQAVPAGGANGPEQAEEGISQAGSAEKAEARGTNQHKIKAVWEAKKNADRGSGNFWSGKCQKTLRITALFMDYGRFSVQMGERYAETA